MGKSGFFENNTVIDEPAKHRFLFVGASNTVEDSQIITNGSYVTKLRDYRTPWKSMIMITSASPGFKLEGMKDRTGNIGLKNVEGFITKHNPNMILYVLGGNDFVFGKSVADFRKEFISVIDKVNTIRGDQLFQSYIANIYGVSYWVNLNSEDTARANAYQDAIAEISTLYNMPLIDFYNATRWDQTYTQSASNTHLTEKGMVKIAQVINDTIGQDLLTTMTDNPMPEISVPISSSTPEATSTEEVSTTINTSTTDTTSQSNPSIMNFLPVIITIICIPIFLNYKKNKSN